MTNRAHLLNDKEMRDFITSGYVKVKADFPESFHEDIFQRLESMFEHGGNLGNNVLPLIPEIQQVFDHPNVHGAMTSVLGPNYAMHPHRYCHFNPPGSGGQNSHKDTYEGDEQVKRHRCRWAMAFYYPQNTTEEMGPTGILPNTQYYETGQGAHSQPELALCGEAGTVAIVHYDLWHRAMPNKSDKKRYMLKFLFTRLEEPKQPSWDSENAKWQPHNSGSDLDRNEAMWCRLWDWNCGEQNGGINRAEGPGGDDVPTLIAALEDAAEVVRLNAAYSLAMAGSTAVPALMKTLSGESETARHHATFALGSAGSIAVPALIDGLSSENLAVRTSAAYALGDIGPVAQAAVSVLTQSLRDESEWVRRHTAEALGLIGQPTTETVPGLVALLRDKHEWVRDNAARALAKIGPMAEPAVPELAETLNNDESRYVRFHAALALKQIDTPASKNILFHHLLTSRWCALTTRTSPY